MKQRYDWLDVMKGFTMILVVFGHALNSQGFYEHSVNVWIHEFHMPFFFLLSGFLAEKTLKRRLKENIIKKFKTLILPFFSCGILYATTVHQLDSFVFLIHHAGYWFLFSLFTQWLIFLFAYFLYRKICPPYLQNILIEGVWLISPFFLGNIVMKELPDNVLNITSFPLTFCHYRFFVMGYFMGKIFFANTLRDKLKDTNKFECINAVAILSFIYVSLIIFTNSEIVKKMPVTIWNITLSFTLFLMLYKLTPHIHPNIKNIFCYIGRNSLSVYVFHTFFVYTLPFPNICAPENYQVLLTFGVAVLSIVGALTMGCIFKTNRVLSFIFLGQEWNRKK